MPLLTARARARLCRLLHGESIPSSPPLKKKGKKEEKEREKATRPPFSSLLFSSHRVRRYTAHRERRRGLKSENPLFPPSPPDPACKTEMELPLGGIGLLRANLPPTFHQQGKRIYRDIYLSILPPPLLSSMDSSAYLVKIHPLYCLRIRSIGALSFVKEKKKKGPFFGKSSRGGGRGRKNTLNRRHVVVGDSSSGREIGQGSNR